MQKPVIDTVRGQLISKRNRLLEKFFQNPTKTSLAIEIKWIDDQVADLTARMVEAREGENGCGEDDTGRDWKRPSRAAATRGDWHKSQRYQPT